MDLEYKKCCKCKIEFLASYEFFHSNKSKKDGFSTECKKCKALQDKIYRENNKEKLKIKSKIYGDNNKDKIHLRQKEFYLENKDKILLDNKKHYQENKDQVQTRNKIWHNNNIEKVREYQKQYKQDNKERRNRNEREKYNSDPNRKIVVNLRNRINKFVKDKEKSKTTMELLGCSLEEFKKYFSNQFIIGMTWDKFMNGEIHMDHMVPCIWFDLKDPEQQKLCFHYSNIQPLWEKDNLIKNDNLFCYTDNFITEDNHKIITKKELKEMLK
jgi:hypothetical protein